ncbi:hypothetical protein GCM10027291_19600 [Telluribacter humicola]
MGLRMDDDQYMRLPRKPDNLRFKGILPPSYNLKEYLPEAGDQGDFGTCVGWSTAYYMRTIMQAKKNGWNNQAANIAKARFSPAWIYNQIKKSTDYDCQGGASLADALELMKNKGTAMLACAPNECGSATGNCDQDAANFKIQGYATLFNSTLSATPASEKILAIKSALVESENAVLIGMLMTHSFLVEAKDTWKAAPGESPESNLGGHAMAVIGYDDSINGGSFLIVNSWGKGWGDNGLTWANYDDMIRFTKYAFQVFPEPTPKPQPNVIALKGNMEFTLTGGNMPVHSLVNKGIDVTPDQPNSNAEMITYTMSNGYTSGTRFKMAINNNKQSYVYIIGSDQQNRVSKLFPVPTGTSTNVSPIIPSSNAVLMPSPNSSFTLDNVAGEDYFVVFISEKELNLDEVATKIKNTNGTIVQKAYAALGEDFISPRDMTYEPNQIAFEVKGSPKGSVVPLLVKIEHK